MKLQLPYPPSINHYWRKWRNRMVISTEGRAYREHVYLLVAQAGLHKALTCRLSVIIDVYPPDKRRRDIDNIQKPLLDALGHAGVYEDDSQIDVLWTTRCPVVAGGKVVVEVRESTVRISGVEVFYDLAR